jgi:hypothetical protein
MRKQIIVIKIYKEENNVLKGNIEAHLFNRWCSGKAKSVTYSEGVFITLGFQHAMRTRHIFCDPFGSTIFPHYLIKGTIFK